MPPPVNRTMSVPEWAMLLSLSVLWGGSFFFTRVALSALPPFTIVLLRVGLAALILNAAMPLLGLEDAAHGSGWAAFFGMGLLNNTIPFCLIGGAKPTSRQGLPPS